MKGLTKDDSATIGFVTACLFAGAININEFSQWVLFVVENQKEIPSYLLDLLDFKEALFKIYKVIGFVPPWPGTEDEKLALLGIAYNRGREPFQCPLKREEAVEKLRQFPSVQQTFVETFPFLPRE